MAYTEKQLCMDKQGMGRKQVKTLHNGAVERIFKRYQACAALSCVHSGKNGGKVFVGHKPGLRRAGRLRRKMGKSAKRPQIGYSF